MESGLIRAACILFRKEKYWFFLSTILISLNLFGCAASEVSRGAESNIDLGVRNARNLVGGIEHSDLANQYYNTSQMTKGLVMGGAAGAITGAAFSSVGIFPGTAIGMILGGSYGAYIDSQTTLEDKLANRGVVIVELGDQILIVMPSARLFNSLTPTIKPSAYSTLTLVATYLNQYTKMFVKVAGYTNRTGTPCADIPLSQQQAMNVAKFLIAAGLDSRLVYADGYGGAHLVETNSHAWEGSDNYRIEITTEKLYV